MRVYPILIGLLLVVPWGLFGIVLVGAASSTVARWLGRRRRPLRLETGSRSITPRQRMAA